jgi:hypothetical protein
MGIFARREQPGRRPLGPAILFLDRIDAAKRRDRMNHLSTSLRRVRRDLETCRRQEFLPGKRTRVQAGRLAYIDLLVEACRLLEVEHELDALAGVDRQLEVLRVEAALDTAGMNLQLTS